ncbi:hypothetical protein HPB47_020011 [Ixodes persulcatus]|uniref:Uncharacterized protein n=1 Tax=Ixodes persulcatus TaxID=34615 RepID=A0AC60QGP5_IXOPE|nr:hypothetical protein HPB47_020011 [Ixodes persulcatus]
MALPWVDDLKLWPKIQRSFIYEYMITRQDIDGKPSQNFKGFVEALNLLDSGHVGTILVRQGAGLCELKSEVRGLTGSACTDVQCKWNASTAKNVVPAPLEVIYGLKSGKAGFPQFDSHRALQEHFKCSGFRSIEGTILASVMDALLKSAPLQVVRASLEEQTRGQDSSQWQTARKLRITASTAGSIPKTASPEKWIARRLNNTFRGNENTRHVFRFMLVQTWIIRVLSEQRNAESCEQNSAQKDKDGE